MKFLAFTFFLTLTSLNLLAANKSNYELEIKKDFCGCQNNESIMGEKCEMFCKFAPKSVIPFLYLNTNISNSDSEIKNLSDFCSIQMTDDVSTPQCLIEATSQNDEPIILPLYLLDGQYATSDVSGLIPNKKYSLKIVEKRASEAESMNKINVTISR